MTYTIVTGGDQSDLVLSRDSELKISPQYHIQTTLGATTTIWDRVKFCILFIITGDATLWQRQKGIT